MSQRFQGWLLKNTTGLQYLINDRLAKRGGAFGRLGKALEMGERQYSAHTMGRMLKVVNHLYVLSF
jgi:hypothetical protein